MLLFHLWPNRLGGGFVGVDVFFVISGFLITSHLLREVDKTGRLNVFAFWAARARRLLPAALLVLLATSVAVILWVPRSLWHQYLGEVIASAAYVQNWRLAADSVDYLAAANLPSASQHFWSLSVEEQFYVFLPLVILATIALRRGKPRSIIPTAFVAITVASFAYCIYLTDANPGVAYFSTFTRMWEFGVGALAALATTSLHKRSSSRMPMRGMLAIAGAAAIFVSLFVIDTETAFPGYAALLPVLGTVAVIRWGEGTVVDRVGAFAPVAFLGRVSYALYLWHWPLIVIAPMVTLHPLTTTEKLLIGAASIGLAWASTRFFEEPIRFSLAPRARPAYVLGAVLVAMTPVILISGFGIKVINNADATNIAGTAELLRTSPPCLGASSMDPSAKGCPNPDLSGILIPQPAQAVSDDSNRPACWSGRGASLFNVCQLGPKSGYSLHLIAVGDSHNNTLIAAYARIAKTYNWRIDVAGRRGCYWTTAVQVQPNDEESRLCLEWKQALADHLGSGGPFDAIVTTYGTNSLSPVIPPPGTTRNQATVDGLANAWATQPAKGVPVIAIRDNPHVSETHTQCVERFGLTDPAKCATSRRQAFADFDGTMAAVKRTPGSALVDMSDYYCTKTTCPAVIGGVMVHRDAGHLTASYVTTLAPYLGAAIRSALRAQGVD